jgi:hypothetical protein
MRTTKQPWALTLAVLAATSVNAQTALQNEDVVKLLEAGLSTELVQQIVDTQPADFDLAPDQLVLLRQGGVPEEVLSAMLGHGEATPSDTTLLPAGTAVRVRILEDLDSATALTSDPVAFEVAAAVAIDGMTAIPAGAVANGAVLDARKKRGFGRRGRLQFQLDSVTAADGTAIPVAFEREVKGNDSYSKAGVVTLLTGPFGIFVKGKNVRVPAGTEYTLFTVADATLAP